MMWKKSVYILEGFSNTASFFVVTNEEWANSMLRPALTCNYTCSTEDEADFLAAQLNSINAQKPLENVQ